LGQKIEQLVPLPIESEKRLEELLVQDISVLDPKLMIVGRQVSTGFGSIDILAMNEDGDIAVIELKKDKTPREVVAQVLDYGSWVRHLKVDRLQEIYENWAAKSTQGEVHPSLDKAFLQKFGSKLPDAINERHELVIVATSLDPSSERIVSYLSDQYGISIGFSRKIADPTMASRAGVPKMALAPHSFRNVGFVNHPASAMHGSINPNNHGASGFSGRRQQLLAFISACLCNDDHYRDGEKNIPIAHRNHQDPQ